MLVNNLMCQVFTVRCVKKIVFGWPERPEVSPLALREAQDQIGGQLYNHQVFQNPEELTLGVSATYTHELTFAFGARASTKIERKELVWLNGRPTRVKCEHVDFWRSDMATTRCPLRKWLLSCYRTSLEVNLLLERDQVRLNSVKERMLLVQELL